MSILNEAGLTEKEFLEAYDASIYPKPSLTADVLLFTVDSIKNNNYKKNDQKVLKLLLIKKEKPSLFRPMGYSWRFCRYR